MCLSGSHFVTDSHSIIDRCMRTRVPSLFQTKITLSISFQIPFNKMVLYTINGIDFPFSPTTQFTVMNLAINSTE